MENPFETITTTLSKIAMELAAIKKQLNHLTDNHSNARDGRLLSVQEAAEYLHIPVASVYQLCHHRKLPYYRPSKRSYFKKQDLDEYMQINQIRSQTEPINSSLPARKRRNIK